MDGPTDIHHARMQANLSGSSSAEETSEATSNVESKASSVLEELGSELEHSSSSSEKLTEHHTASATPPRQKEASQVDEQAQHIFSHKEIAEKFGISEKEVQKIIHKASEVLGTNQSTFIQIGKSKGLATMDRAGNILLSREVSAIGKGALGKVKMYEVAGEQGMAVLKITRHQPENKIAGRAGAQREVRNEYEMLVRIYDEASSTKLVGIQDKPHQLIVISGKKGEEKEVGYLGGLYHGDGVALSFDTDVRSVHNLTDAVHQLFTGLSTLQKLDVAHSDIKPGNLLFRKSPSEEGSVKYELALADLGGAQFMGDATEEPIKRGTHTPSYTSTSDKKAMEALKRDLDEGKIDLAQYNEKAKEILKAGDVYSLALSFVTVITGTMMTDSDKEIEAFQTLSDMVPQEYSQMGFGRVYNKLYQACNQDYTKRPTVDEILAAISSFKENIG